MAYINPNGSPDATRAQLIDLQRQDFNTRFRPLESALIQKVQTNGEAEANAAAADVTQQAALSRGEFMRNLARTGTQLTARQENAIGDKRGLDAARNVASAKNITRRAVKDENLQRQADLIGTGRDIVQGANQGLSSAAGMATARKRADDAAAQASKAQRNNMIATGLGMAAAFFL